jgi:hypothetical protein
MAVKDILVMIENAIEELVTLEIVTAVGPVQPAPPADQGGKLAKPALDPGAKVIRTRIDILRSGVTTEIDPAFATGDYQGLRQFHAEREKVASDMMKSHVETVKSLIELVEQRIVKGAGTGGS